jgi:hypothetical protein
MSGKNNQKPFHNDSEVCFFRSLHDGLNPYAQISRAMLHDKDLSLKAKGLLSYLLSLPGDWKIYHSQLMHALNCGESCLNSGFEELIEAGYAKRERSRSNKGTFNPYRYEISEFKKFQPDRIIQPGLSSPENPVIQKKEEHKEKQQQQTCSEKPAAVSFSKEVHCLEGLGIPEPDKEWLIRNHNVEAIIEAVAWATHPSTKLNGPLAAAIKWACKNKPQIPETQQDTIDKNKKYAKEIEKKQAETAGGYQINALSKHIEIVCYPYEFCLEYTENGFKEQLDNELLKRNILKPQKE